MWPRSGLSESVLSISVRKLKAIINHGIAVTNLRFDDALYLLRDSLKEHPSEFAVIHCLYASGYDSDKTKYETMLRELLSREDLKDYFVPFRRDLTVGDMRGKTVEP